MHQSDLWQLLLMVAGTAQLDAGIFLLIDVKLHPSGIRLSLLEAAVRVLRVEPLWLQWAYAKVLFWRFGREFLAVALIVGSALTFSHITRIWFPDEMLISGTMPDNGSNALNAVSIHQIISGDGE